MFNLFTAHSLPVISQWKQVDRFYSVNNDNCMNGTSNKTLFLYLQETTSDVCIKLQRWRRRPAVDPEAGHKHTLSFCYDR